MVNSLYLCINILTPLPEEQRAQGESFIYMTWHLMFTTTSNRYL